MPPRWRANPVLYEINTWPWLDGLRRQTGRRLTLADVPDAEIARLARYNFDAIWLMGIWERSPAARTIAQTHSGLLAAYREASPDYQATEVVGSPYAIYRYRVDPEFGGEDALLVLRRRLREHGLRLILDFVPNHLAVDHEWVRQHPERFVSATEADLAQQPHDYFTVDIEGTPRVFAHGRDPNFPGWSDTVQLDYRQPETRRAMTEALREIAAHCDGVRCDMAMLPLREVFLRTWGEPWEPADSEEFWPAAIREVKAAHPDFLLLAEAYWDLEWELQQQGFDYTYDKRLYDRLAAADFTGVSAHLRAGIDYQQRLARFIENHDERCSVAVFGAARTRPVATLALTLPGLRLLHEGQLEGRQIKLPVQLGRRPQERAIASLEAFYSRLLSELHHPVFHEGEWQLLQPQSAWPGNSTHVSLVAHCWMLDDSRRLIVVNLSDSSAQCLLPLRALAVAGSSWQLSDNLSEATFLRDGDEMTQRGLYLDLPAYGCHLFELQFQARKLPPGVEQRCALSGHSGGIYALAWSRDGAAIASAGQEKVIRLWSARDGTEARRFESLPDIVGCLAWSPDGLTLAAGCNDKALRLADVASGSLRRTLFAHDNSPLTLAWSPDGRSLASGGLDRRVILWDATSGQVSRTFQQQTDAINCIVWSPDGRTLASGSGDRTIWLWDVASGASTQVLAGRDWVGSVAWSPDGSMLASGTGAGTVEIWSPATGHQLSIREGHTQRVLCVAFSADGRLLASKSADGTVRLWRCDTWEQVAALEEVGEYLTGLAFHPTQPVLATRDDRANVIRIWDLDMEVLLGTAPKSPSVHYTNAKVVVVGYQSTGKTCLIRALQGLPFEPQLSTHSMVIHPFHTETVSRDDRSEVIREILLWDLAGQREYEIVHQLFLDETSLGIVVFDPSGPQHDPFMGVPHWEQALRRVAGEDCPRLLVAGRVDRGYPHASAGQVETFCREHGFREFIVTSANTGRGVDDLRAAIAAAIPWDTLPVTSSPELWNQIRGYLIQRRAENDVLERRSDLRSAFARENPHAQFSEAEFDKVISHAQVQGLVRRLSFGDYILMQPELLSTYAAAIVRYARRGNELGSVSERDVLQGQIEFEDLKRLNNPMIEGSLLHAVVELLLKREVALREGEHLVFPSKLNRPRPESIAPVQNTVAYRFAGAVENIYATLIVRLFYGRAFDLKERWNSGAEFRDWQGRTCVIEWQHGDDGSGVMNVAFAAVVSTESKVLLLKFIEEHLQKSANHGSVSRARIYSCGKCGEEVGDRRAVSSRLQRRLPTLVCQYCGASISLFDALEKGFADPNAERQVQALEQEVEAKKEHELDVSNFKARQHVGQFDVFLAYNSEDLEAVLSVGAALIERRVNPWVDKWNLPPGQRFQNEIGKVLPLIRSVAVFIGSSGFGPWQSHEINIAINQCTHRGIPVIPVLLPGATMTPEEFSPFLGEFTAVRFNSSVAEHDVLDELHWGIRGTGTHPRRPAG